MYVEVLFMGSQSLIIAPLLVVPTSLLPGDRYISTSDVRMYKVHVTAHDMLRTHAITGAVRLVPCLSWRKKLKQELFGVEMTKTCFLAPA